MSITAHASCVGAVAVCRNKSVVLERLLYIITKMYIMFASNNMNNSNKVMLFNLKLCVLYNIPSQAW